MSFRKFSDDRSKQDFSCHFCNERLPTLDDMRTHLINCASKTDQCPHCRKYILRSIYAYHIDNNCTNPDLFDIVTINHYNSNSRSFYFRRQEQQQKFLLINVENLRFQKNSNHYLKKQHVSMKL